MPGRDIAVLRFALKAVAAKAAASTEVRLVLVAWSVFWRRI